ncbi:MAG: LPS export ABC transporter ATP-binding protein [Pseudomonadota bacterium]
MSATEDGLIVRGLAKSFGKRQVVRDVSLAVQRGEVVGLLGPNGAGKTTCFYMIMGLIGADAGHILIDGEDVTALPMYQRARLGVGYLPQEASIFRGMSVEENVAAVVELVEKDKSKRAAQVDALLNELHVSHLRKAPATALSGGERRRVEIARALASRPSFMLLDEPFTGIDPLAISDISDLVRYLKQRGLGVLITDHQVRETLQIVDRALVMYDGAVLFDGPPSEVLQNEDVRRVYLGERFAA